ncbi:amidophosphoribosyltransferase [Solibacillus kalamii]|uniref:Amidophosphoribosyltransferase n=3 Tax=Solibacillus TaxID=648800 RepID=F2F7H9_SOLSS|nr:MULTISPECIES: amidophosphoribosyltransferase [Solibacillus]AMO87070.1 amidophosphoribosyltransferase [Solibacillus silvestris]EKB43473.1 Amidophosphoribosyltransferase precursor [Solibacillus isronensis B3W22]MBM7665577.1 amidophosphoribosyltransferase [Solibacillus kalamii]OBW51687.1 amidophosphoribosyltransferase [Solibacillus silvestris]OUZ38974.1 amidophosphoribosyltransferase [Solibacillus kalamii]
MLAEIRGLNEECGVFGIWGNQDAAHLSYYGLHALQHRGQEGAGIVTTDGNQLQAVRGEGLVNDVFNENKLRKVVGHAAIAHVRYATAGGKGLENVQPLLFRSSTGSLAIAHNGNLVNATHLKQFLERSGSIFNSTSDTEVVVHLIKKSKHSPFRSKVKEALSLLKGAFSIILLTNDQMIVARDRNGLRPLSLGKLGDSYVVASETCAFDLIGAEYVREVEPGELLIISNNGLEVDSYVEKDKRTMCAMEYVYLARPDSNIDEVNIHMARKRMGKELAKECAHIEADVVTGVPDSSISAAIGFSEASGIPYELGLIKNRYVGRTFIQPTQELRERGVKMKLSPVVQVVKGKRVVMVDDSIVRGTTSRRIVRMLKEAGAAEVHVVISSPPMTDPCYYGIDTSTHEELIASSHSVEDIRVAIEADTLTFLSLEGMVRATNRPFEDENGGLCVACFTGKYPTEIFPDTVLPHEKDC